MSQEVSGAWVHKCPGRFSAAGELPRLPLHYTRSSAVWVDQVDVAPDTPPFLAGFELRLDEEEEMVRAEEREARNHDFVEQGDQDGLPVVALDVAAEGGDEGAHGGAEPSTGGAS